MNSTSNHKLPETVVNDGATIAHQNTLDQLLTVQTQILGLLQEMKKNRGTIQCNSIVQKLIERYNNLNREELTTLLMPTINNVQLASIYCQGITKKGTNCKRRPMKGKLYCKDHYHVPITTTSPVAISTTSSVVIPTSVPVAIPTTSSVAIPTQSTEQNSKRKREVPEDKEHSTY